MVLIKLVDREDLEVLIHGIFLTVDMDIMLKKKLGMA